VFFVFAVKVCGQTKAPAHPLVAVDGSGAPILRNTISKEELRIPRKAIEELLRAQRDYTLGNVRSSVHHLENALKLYPNYLEARNNLGAQYIELQEYEKAVAQFQRAIQINDRVVQPFNNLSVALFTLQRYADAEAAARHALGLDPSNSITRYLLGCTLATEDRNAAEALEMLRATESVFPESRLLIAKILLRQGSAEDARKELRDYLAVPGIEKRAVAEQWLAQLTGTPETGKNSGHSDGP
jgi:tetratricopeptide (TPR) repeat protein